MDQVECVVVGAGVVGLAVAVNRVALIWKLARIDILSKWPDCWRRPRFEGASI